MSSTILSIWKGPLELPAKRRRTMASIAAEVAASHRLTLKEIRSADRTVRIVYPRQDAMFLQHEEGHAYAAIGRWWGMDHTTVIHACRRHLERAGGAA